MSDKITVVRDKKALLKEYEQLNRLIQDYTAFLRESGDGKALEKDAIRVLREQQLTLQQARASLRTVDLVCALIRQVVTGLHVERFSFKSLPDLDVEEVAETSPEDVTPERMVAWVNANLSRAPLEVQEKVRVLLGAVLRFFRELAEENARGVEHALTRMNLLTSNPKTQSMVREIAVITRDIFSSLQAVSEGLPLDQLSESSGGISDAVKKLHSVIARLDDAADQNLDNLEKVNQMTGEKAEKMEGVMTSLHAAQAKLMALKEANPDLADRLGAIQDRLSDEVGAAIMALQMSTSDYQDSHLELISNQSFQELTGRTLRKIIEFVETIEREMLELLREFSPALELDALEKAAEAPPVTKPEAAPSEPAPGESAPQGQTQTQEDVDKLMAELGF